MQKVQIQVRHLKKKYFKRRSFGQRGQEAEYGAGHFKESPIIRTACLVDLDKPPQLSYLPDNQGIHGFSTSYPLSEMQSFQMIPVHTYIPLHEYHVIPYSTYIPLHEYFHHVLKWQQLSFTECLLYAGIVLDSLLLYLLSYIHPPKQIRLVQFFIHSFSMYLYLIPNLCPGTVPGAKDVSVSKTASQNHILMELTFL